MASLSQIKPVFNPQGTGMKWGFQAAMRVIQHVSRPVCVDECVFDTRAAENSPF